MHSLIIYLEGVHVRTIVFYDLQEALDAAAWMRACEEDFHCEVI